MEAYVGELELLFRAMQLLESPDCVVNGEIIDKVTLGIAKTGLVM
jgi:hypothetical protein